MDGALGRNASLQELLNMASGLSKAVLPGVMLGLLATSALAFSQETAGQRTTAPGPQTARRIVDEIGLVKGMPPKEGERQTDPHALAIVELGKAAGPFLVAKLTDASPSQVAYLYSYAIGDLALALLTDIYKPSSWPFPDTSSKLPEKYGDYRDYVEFVHSPGGRKRLRQSWRRFIRDQGAGRPSAATPGR